VQPIGHFFFPHFFPNVTFSVLTFVAFQSFPLDLSPPNPYPMPQVDFSCRCEGPLPHRATKPLVAHPQLPVLMLSCKAFPLLAFYCALFRHFVRVRIASDGTLLPQFQRPLLVFLFLQFCCFPRSARVPPVNPFAFLIAWPPLGPNLRPSLLWTVNLMEIPLPSLEPSPTERLCPQADVTSGCILEHLKKYVPRFPFIARPPSPFFCKKALVLSRPPQAMLKLPMTLFFFFLFNE